MELFQGLAHIAIQVKDIERSIAFYEKLGGKLRDRGEPHPGVLLALVDFGGLTLELIQSPATPKRPDAIDHFALAVSDVDAAMAFLRGAGVDSFEAPEKTVMPDLFGGMDNCFFYGPDGERIELLKMHN